MSDMLTVPEIQADLRISRAKAYSMVQSMPHMRIGKSIRVERSDYEAWKAGRKVVVA